jgi:replicative DNA helicase
MSQIKVNFELIAIAKLLREQDQELFMGLNTEVFSGQYQQLYKLITKEFSTSHKIPNLQMLTMLINEKAPASLRPVLSTIIATMESVDIFGIANDSVINGLKDKHLLTTVDHNIQELNNLAMLRDTQGVRKVLNQIIEDINLDSVAPTNLFEAMEAPDKSRIITSGIAELDEHISGVAGLTIISGSSGGGKSIALLQMAVGQFLAGYNILYVSLELSAQVLGNRLKSFITGIPFSKINKDNGALLSDDERKQIKEAMDKFKDRENVFRIVTDPLDTNELLNLMKIEKDLYNIDVSYLDYLNLVSAPRGTQSGWQNLADTAKSLHRLSMQLGIITISASQVTLDKAPKSGKYPEVTTRGSKELEFSATLWIFIYSPEADEDGGNTDAAVWYVLKNRNAQRCQLLFEKRFSEMKFQFCMEI